MSKKAAEGLAALVLDVKVGKAALLSDEAAARQLARLLVTCLRVLLSVGHKTVPHCIKTAAQIELVF